MIGLILNIFLFLGILVLETVFSGTALWWLLYLNLFMIIGIYKFNRKKQEGAIIFILVGSILVDFLAYRQVGLQAFCFFSAILIVLLLSKVMAFLDNQPLQVKLLLSFIIFLLIQGNYIYWNDLLSVNRILLLYMSNILLLTGALIISSVRTKSRNVFKI